MRYEAQFDPALGETRVTLTSNCYTDALPMLQTIIFRQDEFDLKSQALPLACAILTAAYCGDQFEFVGTKIGNDYAEAIRMVLGDHVHIAGVDGHHRTISTGEVDMLVEKARANGRAPAPQRPQDTTPMARIDWSADFVAQDSRSSALHAFGQVHTNAEFFADPTTVSIALALLAGRDKLRNIYVEHPGSESRIDLYKLSSSLNAVSVGVELLEAA
jgi:hypothetical protein